MCFDHTLPAVNNPPYPLLPPAPLIVGVVQGGAPPVGQASEAASAGEGARVEPVDRALPESGGH